MRKAVISVSMSPMRPIGLIIFALALCAGRASAAELAEIPHSLAV